MNEKDIYLNEYDAILVPGTGYPSDPENPTESLPIWVKYRLDRLIRRYQEQESKTPIISLSAGNYYRAPVSTPMGYLITESAAMALYLHERGIERIYEEASSFDTVGNAYYARSIHCEPRKWRKLLVVSNDFHHPRVKLVFDWVFKQPINGADLNEYQIDYWSVSLPETVLQGDLREQSPSSENEGDPRLKQIIQARSKKEKESYLQMIERIDGLKETVTDWEELHQWFFTEHLLYSVKNRRKLIYEGIGNQLNPDCLASY